MCGILGIYNFKEAAVAYTESVQKALARLQQRGPDDNGTYFYEHVALGHTRLSVIDTTSAGHQPMTDENEGYAICFNGEIFNFHELQKDLAVKGFSFRSHSDTEVLLKAFMAYGENCLQKLNGFFAFAVFNKKTGDIFLARDRYGEKPVYYYQDDDKFIFASELKAILAFDNIDKHLDTASMVQYLHFNYIPHPHSIFRNVRKLAPGHFIRINSHGLQLHQWYQMNFNADVVSNYGDQQNQLYALLDNAVRRRLLSDVPVGAFLSGGIDSSVITGLATKYKKGINTFSIGFKDNRFFDETEYAEQVARRFNTNHHTFSLSYQDMVDQIGNMLDYMDEPFADSSSLAVYILSQKTSEKVKVALSGDGADELFGGYNKYKGEWQIRNAGFLAMLTSNFHFLWKRLPQSRNNFLTNKIRQLSRFSDGMRLSAGERYWQWSGFTGTDGPFHLFSSSFKSRIFMPEYDKRKAHITKSFDEQGNINQVLYHDLCMVLPDDMLYKVDHMAMAHGLEVRSPFLDPEVVNFGLNLPADAKVSPAYGKKILQDTFRDFLPGDIYKRPKKGFEVPLLNFLKKDLRPMIDELLLDKDFIQQQDIFDITSLQQLTARLYAASPGDAHAKVWAILVFQYWWKKYMC